MMTRQARHSRSDHGLRHPHDLGNRACSASKHQNTHQAINRASHHLAEAMPLIRVRYAVSPWAQQCRGGASADSAGGPLDVLRRGGGYFWPADAQLHRMVDKHC